MGIGPMSKYEFNFLVPLINFESAVTPIRLQNGFTIRRISNYEQEEIHEQIKQWSGITIGKFLLEYVITTKNPQSTHNDLAEEASMTIEKAVTVLRLYKPNLVGSQVILQPIEEPPPYSTSTYTLKHYPPVGLGSGKPAAMKTYRMSTGEANDFKTFFKRLYGRDFASFAVAVTYFNKSYTESHRPGEALIDLLHTLENLYLRGDHQETTYKLCVRMAHHLTSEWKKKKTIFNDIQWACEYRDNRLFGETGHQPMKSRILFRIRNYARESLKQFIQYPKRLDKQVQNEGVLKK